MKKLLLAVFICVIVSVSLFADLNEWANEHLIFDNKNYTPEIHPVTEDGKSGFIILDPYAGNYSKTFSFVMNTEIGASSHTGNIKTEYDDGFVSLKSDKMNTFITNDPAKVPESNMLSEFFKGILAGNYPTKQELSDILNNSELYDTQTIIIASLIPISTYSTSIAMSSEKEGAVSFGVIHIDDNDSDIPLLSYMIMDSGCKAIEIYSNGYNSSYSLDVFENASVDNSYSELAITLKKVLGLIYEPTIIFIGVPFIPVYDPIPSWYNFDFIEENGRVFSCGSSENTGNYERDLKLAIRNAESNLSSHIYNYYFVFEPFKSKTDMTGNGYFEDIRLEETFVSNTGEVYVLVSISSDGYDHEDIIHSTGFSEVEDDSIDKVRKMASDRARITFQELSEQGIF